VADTTVEIDYTRSGKGGKCTLTVTAGGGTLEVDKLDVTSKKAREAFIESVCKKFPGLVRDALSEQLLDIAKKCAGDSGATGTSQSESLVQLCKDVELFHPPGAYHKDGYALCPWQDEKGHLTLPIRSSIFRSWLIDRYFEKFGKPSDKQAVTNAIETLNSRAVMGKREHEVFTRLASRKRIIYLDLAHEEGRVVRITPKRWSVIKAANAPVRFVRTDGMRPLPVPKPGGDINELRALVNLSDDNSWVLFVAWLFMTLNPHGPYPILVVNGEQGSAKTTLCNFARGLIDPNVAPLRRLPKEDRDLMIAASNGHIIAFDNLSGIPGSISDALCILSTGGGYATRALYTDAEETIFNLTRPIIINGISDFASRSDLLDRAVHLTLPTISENQRTEQFNLQERFEQLRPRILGALLTAASGSLRRWDAIRLSEKPRMADFARWVTAAEPELGWPAGSFVQTFLESRTATDGLAIESSPVASAVVDLLNEKGSWSGTATELLTELNERSGGAAFRPLNWPKTSKGLGISLRRSMPNLRREGYLVEFKGPQGKENRRIIKLKKIERAQNTAGESSANDRRHVGDPSQHDDTKQHTAKAIGAIGSKSGNGEEICVWVG